MLPQCVCAVTSYGLSTYSFELALTVLLELAAALHMHGSVVHCTRIMRGVRNIHSIRPLYRAAWIHCAGTINRYALSGSEVPVEPECRVKFQLCEKW